MEGSAPSADRAARMSSPALPRLYCLGGQAAPPELGADLSRLARLPPEALQKIWQVLAPSMDEHIGKETEETLDLFCAAYRVDDEELARAIKAVRFVIREAARRDVPRDALSDDLDKLCPEDPLARGIVLAGFEPAKQRVRREIVRAAIAEHGKLLVGVGYRVDVVQSSERGLGLGVPVALLTLHYRDGAEAGKITLQALPDMVGELQATCNRILGRGENR